jgi:O-antigen ligase
LALLARTRQADRLIDLVTLAAAVTILVLPFAWQNASFLGVRLDPTAPSMASGENRSTVERGALNGAGAAIFLEHPAGGVGLGAFPLALKTARPDFPFDYQPAHIALLEVAAETGAAGALFYAALLIAPWLAIWRRRGRLRADPATLALIGASATLLALTVAGFFDYYTWVLVPGRLWQWLGWGMWGTAFQNWSGVNNG